MTSPACTWSWFVFRQACKIDASIVLNTCWAISQPDNTPSALAIIVALPCCVWLMVAWAVKSVNAISSASASSIKRCNKRESMFMILCMMSYSSHNAKPILKKVSGIFQPVATKARIIEPNKPTIKVVIKN